MAYQPNVPLAAQRINDSQPQLLENFQLLDQYFGVNHVAFSAGANQGKHSLINIITQGPAPAVQPVAATEIGLYNKVPEAPFPLTTLQELFIKIPGHGVGGGLLEVPITALSRAITGWCYLPNGLILKWGYHNSGIIVYPVAPNIPVFAGTITSIIVPHTNDDVIARVVNDTNVLQLNTVTVRRVDGVAIASNINYLVIGY